MKLRMLVLLALALVSAVNSSLSTAQAQGTAFTYQGRLNDGASPANGSYDLTFALFNSGSGGSAAAGPSTNAAVGVSNGLFTVGLDFGASVFNGSVYWLEIGVRSNGNGGFSVLAPRQQLKPAPYAIYAEGASAVGLNGTIPSAALGGTYDNALALHNANNNFRGTFVGNGAELVYVNAATLNGLSASSFWNTTGNAGTVPVVNFVGTTDNQPLELRVNFQRAERFELNADSPNVIGGAGINVAGPGVQGVTIAGGGSIATYGGPYPNRADSYHDTIGGGLGNWIQTNANESTIAGGNQNLVQSGSPDSFIGGGFQNIIQGAPNSTIGGGTSNQIQLLGLESTIGGGSGNVIQSDSFDGFIGGGYANQIQNSAEYSVIGGGENNVIQPSDYNCTIAGGWSNTIQDISWASTIGGGYANQIQTYAPYSVIGGGSNNVIQPYSYDSTIAGGAGNIVQSRANASSIGGGYNNQIQNYGTNSFIGGGYANQIQTNAHESTIGGGKGNVIQLDCQDSTIGGGSGNTIQAYSAASVIGGGYQNQILRFDDYSVIVGGFQNQLQAGTTYSAIGGGANNNVRSGGYATIAGGNQNLAGDGIFTGVYASVGGGSQNNAEGNYASVPGGALNWAKGQYSFAAGNRAKAVAQGAFVWADSQAADFNDYTADSVYFRCQGGVLFTSGASGQDQIVSWNPGSGSWSFMSDRNAKENFQPVDTQQVLQKIAQLPLLEWNYKGYGDRHVGPMAQDFHAAFPFNPNDKMINSADEAGVSLAAIQGLNEKVESGKRKTERLEQRLQQKETEITELKARLAALEKIIINQKPN